MLSAFRNFLVSFLISLVIFSIFSYLTVSYASGSMISRSENDQQGVAGETSAGPETTSPGENDDPEKINGSSFNVLLIGTDLQESRFDDYDPSLWLWKSSFHRMLEVSEITKKKQKGLFKYRTFEADSMVLVRVDKERQEFTFTYIPGNMIVLSDVGNVRLGSLYMTGGPDLLRHKVEAITGLVIDYHVCVSVEKVVAVVNSIGIVDFDIPCDMNYTDESQDLFIDIEKGTYRISGTGAEKILRYNGYTDGVNSRGSTTIKYIMTLARKATDISNMTRIGTLFSQISPYVETNLTADFLIKNAGLIFSYSSFRCYEFVYPGKYTVNEKEEKVFIPDIRAAINQFYNYRIPYDA